MSQTKINDLEWMLLTKVAERTGASVNAIREYIKKGYLPEGIVWVKNRGRIWIHIREFNQWVATSTEV
ncbi:MAG: hypothetical protein HN738_01740 [Gammaproteobacteria bacterium]|jgi:hypothetical protein|nr:hypothetical protein [Gammaproteobacteria bacterium]MBT7876785.1 hypothetical protein [Gammaproteobacteria bacterium]